MNRLQLIDVLTEHNISSRDYSTKGYKDDAVCILEESGIFEIAYFERGTKSSHGKYDTESQACKAMLNILGVKL